MRRTGDGTGGLLSSVRPKRESQLIYRRRERSPNDGGQGDDRAHVSCRARLDLGPVEAPTALVHTHCHQKALGRQGATETVLRQIPGLEVHTPRSGCCGMAGAFGYEAEHYDVSMAMGELDLLPSVRDAAPEAWVLGTQARPEETVPGGALPCGRAGSTLVVLDANADIPILECRTPGASDESTIPTPRGERLFVFGLLSCWVGPIADAMPL